MEFGKWWKNNTSQCKHTETWPLQSHSLEICKVQATLLGIFHEWLSRLKHCEDLEQNGMKKKDALRGAETTTKGIFLKNKPFVGSSRHKRNACKPEVIAVFPSNRSGVAMQNNVLTNATHRKTQDFWKHDACQNAENGFTGKPPGWLPMLNSHINCELLEWLSMIDHG